MKRAIFVHRQPILSQVIDEVVVDAMRFNEVLTPNTKRQGEVTETITVNEVASDS